MVSGGMAVHTCPYGAVAEEQSDPCSPTYTEEGGGVHHNNILYKFTNAFLTFSFFLHTATKQKSSYYMMLQTGIVWNSFGGRHPLIINQYSFSFFTVECVRDIISLR